MDKEVFFVKAGVTAGMFIVMAGVSGWVITEIGLSALLFSIPMGILLIVLTGFMWNWGNPAPVDTAAFVQQSGKMKRERIDDIIETLSDEQLYALKARLKDGGLDEDQLAYMLGDDGELVQRG